MKFGYFHLAFLGGSQFLEIKRKKNTDTPFFKKLDI